MDSELFGGEAVIQFKDETTRRSFLRTAALVGVGATLAGGATTAFAAGPEMASQFGEGDVGILNYALTLEYLEADFYAQGTAKDFLGDNKKYLTPIAQHEAAHVQALTGTLQKLGATPAAKPTFKYPDGTFTDANTFLKTANTFEETGVKAYNGQVPLVKDGAILAAAASIAGVESRHAAVLNLILKQKFVPAPVEAHASMDEVVAAIKPFLGG